MSNHLSTQVPIARTGLTEAEIQSVLEPLRSGWLVQGPKVREFETAWSSFTGADHSIAVTSCTTALHLSLAALGFGPGDEAIVSAFTWISTGNVVEHLGGMVVFADINLASFNIDPTGIEALITPRTKLSRTAISKSSSRCISGATPGWKLYSSRAYIPGRLSMLRTFSVTTQQVRDNA